MSEVRERTAAEVQGQDVLVLQEAATACAQGVHQWQTFKRTIEPYRTPSQENKGYGYKQRRAWFIVRGCTVCHLKRNMDMVVERG